ncbi:MAG: thiosulfate dehydrogenase (quinone) large subunit [Patescibacteria group bacterium]|jgi:thiosulfate dehydrogenase [quinone] large subunit|nr:thiosulfate dehydrogenase (quinone) large subunit [Patescibacteria group bacterium]
MFILKIFLFFMNKEKLYKFLRLAMSFIFLWAFFDKTFGLGFATTAEKAWMAEGSPTSGFLLNATKGPFADFFRSLADVGAIDFIFMAGLLGIGLSLLLNKYVKWGSIAGILMMLLMYLASFPPENNPIIDDHIIYALVFAIIAFESKLKFKK